MEGMSVQVECKGGYSCSTLKPHPHGEDCGAGCFCAKGRPEPASRHMSLHQRPSPFDLFRARQLARRFL